MEKQALTKWKQEYHNLSDKNKQKLKKNVMKSNIDVAKGIEKGNQNLMKRHNMSEKIDNKEFQGYKFKNKNITVLSPKNLADFDVDKGNLSKPDKALLKVYKKFTKTDKLNKGDKALYNAQGKRNVINKLTKGLDAQIIGEGAVGPYYDNQKFVKKLKTSRYVVHPDKQKEHVKNIYKDYGKKIDVKNDMKKMKNKEIKKQAIRIGGNKRFAPIIGKGGEDIVVDEYLKHADRYKQLASKEAKILAKNKNRNKKIGIAGLGISAGAFALSKKLKNKSKGEDNMKKTAFDYLDEAIEKRAALSPERMDYYEKKMNAAMEGEDSKDNRSSKELKKSYIKSKAKTAIGVPAAVGGAGMAGAMAPGLMKDFKHGIRDKRRIGIAGRAVGAAAIGAPMAANGIKNLVKDRKEMKSRDNKLKNLWTDYIIEDMNEGRKERQKAEKTAFEMLDEAMEKRAYAWNAPLDPDTEKYYANQYNNAENGNFKGNKDHRTKKEVIKDMKKHENIKQLGLVGMGAGGATTLALAAAKARNKKAKVLPGIIAAGGATIASHALANRSANKNVGNINEMLRRNAKKQDVVANYAQEKALKADSIRRKEEIERDVWSRLTEEGTKKVDKKTLDAETKKALNEASKYAYEVLDCAIEKRAADDNQQRINEIKKDNQKNSTKLLAGTGAVVVPGLYAIAKGNKKPSKGDIEMIKRVNEFNKRVGKPTISIKNTVKNNPKSLKNIGKAGIMGASAVLGAKAMYDAGKKISKNNKEMDKLDPSNKSRVDKKRKAALKNVIINQAIQQSIMRNQTQAAINHQRMFG